MTTAGSYLLVLFLPNDTMLAVGRLGKFRLRTGYYAYVGSARGPGGLAARLARHMRQRKKLHWHIDYLLGHASIVEIWQAPSSQRLECQWARAVLALPGAQINVAGFGSSDCGCLTHLAYLAPSSLPMLRSQLQALGATVWDRVGTVSETGDGAWAPCAPPPRA